jgi:hypothetical protein
LIRSGGSLNFCLNATMAGGRNPFSHCEQNRYGLS